MDGFETAELIRSRKRNRHTPILFLTGFRNDAQLFRGYDLGAVDFLFKPIVPEILRSKVSVFVELARNARLLQQQTEVLAKAELQFRSLLEAAPDATLITRAEGDIVLVNSHTQELFQYERAALLGKDIRLLVPGWSFSPRGLRPETGGPGRELLGVRADGATFPVEISMSPLQTPEGILVTSAVRDITQRRTAEDAILRLNAELEQRVLERTAELMRSNEAMRQFAWAASHDLKEPLRMVITYSQLLSRECVELSGRSRQLLEVIENSGMKMSALLEAVREFMQASEAGQYERTPVDCAKALEQALKLLEDAIRSADAEVTWDPLPTVMGVEVLLVQVLQNLIGNAIKYRGADPPRVHLSAEANGADWVISVRDNGIGIAPQYHERIFGVFRRLHRNEYPGTGIGLAICKTAVERLGGRIWLESELGKGATFRFSVPSAGA
jgi:PAS domain S-box-containing protein